MSFFASFQCRYVRRFRNFYGLLGFKGARPKTKTEREKRFIWVIEAGKKLHGGKIKAAFSFWSYFTFGIENRDRHLLKARFTLDKPMMMMIVIRWWWGSSSSTSLFNYKNAFSKIKSEWLNNRFRKSESWFLPTIRAENVLLFCTFFLLILAIVIMHCSVCVYIHTMRIRKGSFALRLKNNADMANETERGSSSALGVQSINHSFYSLLIDGDSKVDDYKWAIRMLTRMDVG